MKHYYPDIDKNRKDFYFLYTALINTPDKTGKPLIFKHGKLSNLKIITQHLGNLLRDTG